MKAAIALCCGVIFGIGLTLSGMIDPLRVLGFLDFAGKWDPTLAFVMASALVPAFAGYAISRRLRAPLAAQSFKFPQITSIDSIESNGI